jgi:phospholipid N-methyltransferase
MVTGVTLQSADTVVELGPGTGAFTRAIQDTIVPSATFFALEINQEFATNLRRQFPDLTVHHDSAEKLPEYLAHHGKSEVDCILSGLPWASLPMKVTAGTMTAVAESLRPGGTFATFAYAHAVYLPKARSFRRRLEGLFAKVETSPVVWRNLPPAFVYQCTK